MHGSSRHGRIAVLLVASGIVLPVAIARAVQEMTSDGALRTIVETAYRGVGAASFGRKQSFRTKDWPDDARLIRITRDETPILGVPDLRTTQLEIVGIARSGEIFEVVGTRRVAAASAGRAGAGEWFKVRLIDDRTGWLLAGPLDARSTFAEDVEPDAAPPGRGDGRLVALSILISFPAMLVMLLVLLARAGAGPVIGTDQDSSP
jgi:hypothetical protein